MLRELGAGDRVLPHNDFRRKTCPGQELSAYADELDGQPIGEDMTVPMDQWHKVFNATENGNEPDGVIEWFQRGLVKLGFYQGPDVDDRQEWGVMRAKVRLAWAGYEHSKGYKKANERPGPVSVRHFMADISGGSEPPVAPPAVSTVVRDMFTKYRTENIEAMDRIAAEMAD